MQVLAMMRDDLNSTPGTRMVEGEGRNLTLGLSSDLHMHAGANGPDSHTQVKIFIKKHTPKLGLQPPAP